MHLRRPNVPIPDRVRVRPHGLTLAIAKVPETRRARDGDETPLGVCQVVGPIGRDDVWISARTADFVFEGLGMGEKGGSCESEEEAEDKEKHHCENSKCEMPMCEW